MCVFFVEFFVLVTYFHLRFIQKGYSEIFVLGQKIFISKPRRSTFVCVYVWVGEVFKRGILFKGKRAQHNACNCKNEKDSVIFSFHIRQYV